MNFISVTANVIVHYLLVEREKKISLRAFARIFHSGSWKKNKIQNNLTLILYSKLNFYIKVMHAIFELTLFYLNSTPNLFYCPD